MIYVIFIILSSILKTVQMKLLIVSIKELCIKFDVYIKYKTNYIYQVNHVSKLVNVLYLLSWFETQKLLSI